MRPRSPRCGATSRGPFRLVRLSRDCRPIATRIGDQVLGGELHQRVKRVELLGAITVQLGPGGCREGLLASQPGEPRRGVMEPTDQMCARTRSEVTSFGEKHGPAPVRWRGLNSACPAPVSGTRRGWSPRSVPTSGRTGRSNGMRRHAVGAPSASTPPTPPGTGSPRSCPESGSGTATMPSRSAWSTCAEGSFSHSPPGGTDGREVPS